MNQEVLTLTPGGQALAQSLGFRAASVVVDNLTNSYLKLTDVGKTIPPWVYGAVVALPPGITRASAKLTATTPAIPGPPVPTSEATLTWTDAVLPPDPGHLLQQVTTGQQNVIGTISAPVGGSTGPTNMVVPAGTQSIGILSYIGGGNNTVAAVTISGHQTGHPYVNFSGGAGGSLGSGGPQWRPFDGTDTSVDVTITAQGANSAEVDVIVSPLVMAVDILQFFQQVLSVQASGTPAAWQAATNRVRINSNAASFSVLGAPSNSYKLLGATLSIRAGAAGFVELSDGASALCDVWIPQINDTRFVWFFGLSTGTAITGAQTGGNTCDGQLYYTPL